MQRFYKKGRVVLAVVFFLLLLASFSDVRGTMPAIYHKVFLYFQFIPSLIKFFSPVAIISVGFIVIILITLLGGRVYCSTICPVGIFQDIILFIKRKLGLQKRFRYKKARNILRYTILSVSILSLLFTGVLILNILDPFAVFGRMASHIYQPLLVGVNNLIVKVLPDIGLHIMLTRPVQVASLTFSVGMLGLIFGLTWNGNRIYCNSVCPVGTFLGLISKLSFYKIQIRATACNQCGKCQEVCKANCIDVKNKALDFSRCVGCFNCLPVCPDKAIRYFPAGKLSKSENKVSIDNKRRFFIAASATYFLAKVVPASAQEQKRHRRGRNKNEVCYFSKGPVAPPGAISIDHLKSNCIACHLCVSVCPTKVLQPAFLDYGLTALNAPQMDYGVNFCNFECRQCGEVCPTGAITSLTAEQKKITQIGKVELRIDNCIVESEGTACGSCSEHCPTQAVRMVPYKNGLTAPEINKDICVGCGACEYACPVTDPHPAIFVVPNEVHELAELPQEEKIEFEETEEFPF